MLISEKCTVKNKLQMLIELVRIHERFSTQLEEEWDYEDAFYEAEEVLTCMGFILEHQPSEKMHVDDILVAELMSINDLIFWEINNGDWEIHYNKSYYDPEIWEIEEYQDDEL